MDKFGNQNLHGPRFVELALSDSERGERPARRKTSCGTHALRGETFLQAGGAALTDAGSMG
jgi:hypothetical protein